jgi:hypothetical protein
MITVVKMVRGFMSLPSLMLHSRVVPSAGLLLLLTITAFQIAVAYLPHYLQLGGWRVRSARAVTAGLFLQKGEQACQVGEAAALTGLGALQRRPPDWLAILAFG